MSAQSHKAAAKKSPPPRSIPDFCARHGICNATYYNGVRRGIMPAFTKLGGRSIILEESEAEWKKRLLAASADAP